MTWSYFDKLSTVIFITNLPECLNDNKKSHTHALEYITYRLTETHTQVDTHNVPEYKYNFYYHYLVNKLRVKPFTAKLQLNMEMQNQ